MTILPLSCKLVKSWLWKCLSCFLFPVCDGGCPLFRLENKFTKEPYNVCPINEDEIIILLDTFYEQQMNKRNV